MEKVKASALDTDTSYDETYTIEYKGKAIEIKPLLSYADMLTFVNFVANVCFDEKTGEYMPEKRDFAIRYAIIEVCTNIELPDSDEDRYRFIYGNEELWPAITDVVGGMQMESIMYAIDAKIDYLVTSKTNVIMNNMNNLYNAVLALIEEFNKQFEGIDDGDIQKVLTALTESGFNENRFVESYMNSVK